MPLRGLHTCVTGVSRSRLLERCGVAISSDTDPAASPSAAHEGREDDSAARAYTVPQDVMGRLLEATGSAAALAESWQEAARWPSV